MHYKLLERQGDTSEQENYTILQSSSVVIFFYSFFWIIGWALFGVGFLILWFELVGWLLLTIGVFLISMAQLIQRQQKLFPKRLIFNHTDRKIILIGYDKKKTEIFYHSLKQIFYMAAQGPDSVAKLILGFNENVYWTIATGTLSAGLQDFFRTIELQIQSNREVDTADDLPWKDSRTYMAIADSSIKLISALAVLSFGCIFSLSFWFSQLPFGVVLLPLALCLPLTLFILLQWFKGRGLGLVIFISDMKIYWGFAREDKKDIQLKDFRAIDLNSIDTACYFVDSEAGHFGWLYFLKQQNGQDGNQTGGGDVFQSLKLSVKVPKISLQGIKIQDALALALSMNQQIYFQKTAEK